MTRRLAAAAAAAALLAGTSTALGFFSGTTSTAGTFSAAPDWTPPAQSAATVQKTEGGVAGYVRPGGTYRVFSALSDSGNPASGVGTATADASALTAGATASALSSAGGPFAVDGTTYSHRSGILTVGAGVAAGTASFSVTAADNASNSATFSGLNVVVDATAPAAIDVQATPSGATVGKPEQGDVVTLTWSEPIDPNSVIAGWSGAATGVVVRITDGGLLGNDVLTVRDATNTAQLPLGSVSLGSSAYVSATVDFGASGTPSTMAMSGSVITITLGTPSSAASGTVLLPTTLAWTPSATATDRAGNPASTATANETGPADVDF